MTYRLPEPAYAHVGDESFYTADQQQAAYAAGLAARVPEGWKLVPIDQDAYPQMAIACQDQIWREFGSPSKATLGYFKRIVSASIAAAPEPVCQACHGTKQVYNGEVCAFCEEQSHD